MLFFNFQGNFTEGNIKICDLVLTNWNSKIHSLPKDMFFFAIRLSLHSSVLKQHRFSMTIIKACIHNTRITVAAPILLLAISMANALRAPQGVSSGKGPYTAMANLKEGLGINALGAIPLPTTLSWPVCQSEGNSKGPFPQWHSEGWRSFPWIPPPSRGLLSSQKKSKKSLSVLQRKQEVMF